MADNAIFGAVRRFWKVVRVLVAAHVALAREEAKRDSARLMMGVVMVGGGFLFISTAWLALHAALLLAAWGEGLPPALAALAVAGLDLLLGLGALMVARSALMKPVMTESRARLAETVTALMED